MMQGSDDYPICFSMNRSEAGDIPNAAWMGVKIGKRIGAKLSAIL